MTEDVDAVYTWVDGSDPAFQAMRRQYAGPAAADQASRYRSNGELRFSLRSLLRYAPWVRRVHILTNGQVPRWLDGSHPRIHLVTHAEVFPEPQCLPTFNSHAIEMCLHRIPGLSRRFLYFNDDFFLGRDVHPADFFTPSGGQVVFLDDFPLPERPAPGIGPRTGLRLHAKSSHRTLGDASGAAAPAIPCPAGLRSRFAVSPGEPVPG
jgi:hypothetical protein